MNGRVEGQLRALLAVQLGVERTGSRRTVEAWVDTAFNGGLVLPRSLIHAMNLPQESSAEAVLADGRTIELELFGCHLDWFGSIYKTQVVAGDGAHPLLGTQLLAGHRLTIDYAAGLVNLE